MRWRTWTTASLVVAAMAAAAGLACDEKHDIPVESVEAQRATQDAEQRAAKKPAATTRELVEGPKEPLRLGEMPVTLDVPKGSGWGLKSFGEGASITLSGPATSGEINIQLTAQLSSGNDPYTAARLPDIFARAKKETDAKPHALNRVVMHTLGPVKVLEQRMISDKDFTGGKLSPEVWGEVINKNQVTGEEQKVRAIINPHGLKWTFTVFVPAAEGKYTARSLTFLSLKVSEYEQDKEFLEQLMSSLKYDPT